jgi:hypothetical protein
LLIKGCFVRQLRIFLRAWRRRRAHFSSIFHLPLA